METDEDIRQLGGARIATSFRIHASYPPSPPSWTPGIANEEGWRIRCKSQLQSWLAGAGCPGYSIYDNLGAYEHYPERGVMIERIYDRPQTTCPRGFREVAALISEHWEQEQVWITRTELELEVIELP